MCLMDSLYTLLTEYVQTGKDEKATDVEYLVIPTAMIAPVTAIHGKIEVKARASLHDLK
jgi:hypothetical protein